MWPRARPAGVKAPGYNCLPRDGALQRIEAGAEIERTLQECARGSSIARGARDHAGMIKQPRVLRAKTKGFRDRGLRFRDSPRFQRRPGEGVSAVNVAPSGIVFAASEGVGFCSFQIVVGQK